MAPIHHLDPSFEVPLVPFPPTVKWTSTSEMLREVFRDVRVPWVRRYLLSPSNIDDIYGLTSAANYSKAYSVIMRANTIASLSQGFKSGMLNVRLVIPVMSHGDLGVGIGIESSNVEDSGDVIFSKSDTIFRCVSNNSRKSHLAVRIHSDTNTIEATYKIFNGQRWKYAILTFNHDSFLEALYDNDGRVCFDKLNAALIQSVVGGVHHDQAPQLQLERNGKSSHKNSYPHAIADNVGEHFFKNVICSYAGGRPMMAIPVFAHGNWSYNYDATALRRMQNWGITERLQRLELSPQAHPLLPLPNAENNCNIYNNTVPHTDVLDCTEATYIDPLPSSVDSTPLMAPSMVVTASPPYNNINNNNNNSSSTKDNGVGFTPIAPMPLPASIISSGITLSEIEEDVRKRKKERRIIKKREAAARSNAKRAERRKKQQQQSLQQKT